MPPTSITIIASPYHVGLRDHRVGAGPNKILAAGLIKQLEALALTIHHVELPRVDAEEGEIGRSFALLRHTSYAVSACIAANSFPLVLSGNCMASAGVACGLSLPDLGFVYFDAHDDRETPAWNTNGYLDAMGLSMLAGESWQKLARGIPGFRVFGGEKFVYCGLRDVCEESRRAVAEAGCEVVWGGAGSRVVFEGELRAKLRGKEYSPALVHLDLDVLDESVGKVNGFESPGGLKEEDLMACMEMVPKEVVAKSLTVCSFNPNLGDGDKIAKIGARAIVRFVSSLLESRALVKA